MSPTYKGRRFRVWVIALTDFNLEIFHTINRGYFLLQRNF